MACGYVSRIKRPNTWLHRPMLQNREESSCQTGAVHTWHFVLGVAVVLLAMLELRQGWNLNDAELARYSAR
jgi:hypothetical protein